MLTGDPPKDCGLRASISGDSVRKHDDRIAYLDFGGGRPCHQVAACGNNSFAPNAFL